MRNKAIMISAAAALAWLPGASALGQTASPPPPRGPMGPPPVVSPELLPDGRAVFRVRAPQASSVTVTGDLGEGLPPSAGAVAPAPPSPDRPRAFVPPPPAVVLTKGEDGVWAGTTSAPVRPGAYRYTFNIDGLPVVDQGNMRTSPSQGRVASLLVVPGDFSEQRAVPHGALSEINYEPTVYGPNAQRRVWVYTPPGYEKGTRSYPVLYLLHGGGDTAESWATAGRANFIMDNLIAEKKAVPFIIVMMSGWTPRGPQAETIDAANDPFNAEFVKDIIPMIQSRYRVIADPAHRALSGLSMGGYQTLTLGMKNIKLFSYVMPMSTGWFTEKDRAAFIAVNSFGVKNSDRLLKEFRWGYGKTDIARDFGLASMTALRAAGMHRINTIEVEGGHQWTTWRHLLYDYAQRIFKTQK